MKPDLDLLWLLKQAVADTVGPGVGAVVSGGIDSSTIVCLARELRPTMTFTGYYDEGPDFDERPYARLVTNPPNHHEIKITPEDIIENIDGILGAFTPPWQGPGAIGQYIVARYASCHVDTVLSGEGGDELFGGYARLLIIAGEEPPEGYENYRLPVGYPTTLKKALAYDWERLPDLLAVDDQACGAWGLKSVAPMTDQRVVDYVLSLPAKQRVGKKLLKATMEGIVPKPILARRDKKGMPGPFVKWGQGPLREFFLDRIGYVPDERFPWDRQWWHDLCNTQRVLA